MTKTRHQHAVIGTLTIAIPFDPGVLSSAVQAENDIKAFAAQHCSGPFAPGHESMRLMSCETRMGKVPAVEPASDPASQAVITPQNDPVQFTNTSATMPERPTFLDRPKRA